MIINLIGNKIFTLDDNIGFVQLMDVMPHPSTYITPDFAVVEAARVSFAAGSKGAVEDKKLINYLLRNGHTSPFEMVEFKFRVKAPIFVFRQWHRHRTWSYNEVSRRYTSENIEFYLPKFLRKQSETDKQGSTNDRIDNDDLHKQILGGTSYIVEEARSLYQYALTAGVSKEQARMFLPVCLYSEMIAKVDLHNLLKFIKLRYDGHAQKEIFVYAKAIYEHFVRPLCPFTAEAFEQYVLNLTGKN